MASGISTENYLGSGEKSTPPSPRDRPNFDQPSPPIPIQPPRKVRKPMSRMTKKEREDRQKEAAKHRKERKSINPKRESRA